MVSEGQATVEESSHQMEITNTTTETQCATITAEALEEELAQGVQQDGETNHRSKEILEMENQEPIRKGKMTHLSDKEETERLEAETPKPMVDILAKTDKRFCVENTAKQ